MFRHQSDSFKNILLFILIAGLLLLLPLGAMAEEIAEDEQVVDEEYVNPFLEENLGLFEEAMALQGYILPGLAYLDDNAGQDQGRHYYPLMEGFVLGGSEVITRFEDGNEFALSASYEDENNNALGLRYRVGGYSFRGNLELNDFATIEDTPADVLTTWTDNRNFGFELGGDDILFSWNHRETDRRWDLTGLNEYDNDRFAFAYDFPNACWDLDFDLVYNRLNSDELGFNSRGSLMGRINSRFDIDERTAGRLGYGLVMADTPNAATEGNFSKHVFSGSITRKDCLWDDFDVTAYGNYESLGGEQTLNTHWDGRYDFGIKTVTDHFDNLKLEAGLMAEYFDVDQIRYEMPGLSEFLIRPGLTSEDLAPYTVRNYGHSYEGYFKGRLRFGNGGSLSQVFTMARHHDNKAPDGAELTEVPGVMPLTLYDRLEWKTGIYTPLDDNVFWQLSNVYRKWDMRLRESDGSQNMFTTSLTWNPDDNSGFSAYYQNLAFSFGIEDVDGNATDQHGLGFDWQQDTGNDISFTLGLFIGEGDNLNHDFDQTRFYGSLVIGPDGMWLITAEYGDSSNDDYEVLDFDAFNAVIYYKIDL